jgi:spermidine synthase
MFYTRHSTYLFSFLLAFCSLFYELVYAQILSVCLGGTKNQYLLTISIFTCALGLGSLLYGKMVKNRKTRSVFFSVEVLLIILGSAGPFILASMLRPDVSEAFFMAKVILSYFFIFFIGLLSGFELPCLFSLTPDSHGKILAFDYLGMLTASLLFPFFFLPQLGTGAATLFVANINVTALIWLMPSNKIILKLLVVVINVVFFGVILLYRDLFNHALSTLYLGSP